MILYIRVYYTQFATKIYNYEIEVPASAAMAPYPAIIWIWCPGARARGRTRAFNINWPQFLLRLRSRRMVLVMIMSRRSVEAGLALAIIAFLHLVSVLYLFCSQFSNEYLCTYNIIYIHVPVLCTHATVRRITGAPNVRVVRVIGIAARIT